MLVCACLCVRLLQGCKVLALRLETCYLAKTDVQGRGTDGAGGEEGVVEWKIAE